MKAEKVARMAAKKEIREAVMDGVRLAITANGKAIFEMSISQFLSYCSLHGGKVEFIFAGDNFPLNIEFYCKEVSLS